MLNLADVLDWLGITGLVTKVQRSVRCCTSWNQDRDTGLPSRMTSKKNSCLRNQLHFFSWYSCSAKNFHNMCNQNHKNITLHWSRFTLLPYSVHDQVQYVCLVWNRWKCICLSFHRPAWRITGLSIIYGCFIKCLWVWKIHIGMDALLVNIKNQYYWHSKLFAHWKNCCWLSIWFYYEGHSWIISNDSPLHPFSTQLILLVHGEPGVYPSQLTYGTRQGSCWTGCQSIAITNTHSHTADYLEAKMGL